MAALMNGVLLYIAVGVIAWEAIGRLLHPEQVKPLTMIIVAAIGVGINTVTALLFLAGQKHDLNVRAAFLHMAADAAVSLGVVIGGIAIGITDWLWLDPALSLLIAAVIAYSTWDILWHALELALDSVPRDIEPEKVRAYFASLPGVTAIHDLHIWGMSTTETALTVHLVRPGASGSKTTGCMKWLTSCTIASALCIPRSRLNQAKASTDATSRRMTSSSTSPCARTQSPGCSPH